MAKSRHQNKSKFVFNLHLLKSAFLIVLGLVLIGFYGIWKFNQIYVAFGLTSDSLPTSNLYHSVDALPQKLAIEQLNISLEIDESIIKDGVWGVSDKGLSHLITSGVPGQKRNIILYGHNKPNILKSLPKIAHGSEISVMTAEGKTYKYYVSKILIVDPGDTWVLIDEGKERLILYTCTGFLDSKRLVVYAELL